MKDYEDLITMGSLYVDWLRFRIGKSNRADVILFERHLEDNLCRLAEDLSAGQYEHGAYHEFRVRDPKPRVIHKAAIRDRIVHQALFSELYPIFEESFFFDSYSSRPGKGVQRAVARAETFIRQVSKNFHRPAWILHGDVKNFFGSIDHQTLLKQLSEKIPDNRYVSLCEKVISSFSVKPGIGIPLGNLTSQLFANVYLHELDYFVKQQLRVKHYLRYNDDFFIVADSKEVLKEHGVILQNFLAERLKLSVPDDKIMIKNIHSGVDVLGTVLYPWGRVPRRRLRRNAEKLVKKLSLCEYPLSAWRSSVSYLGLLKNSRSFVTMERLKGLGNK